jgi:YHS domain-containing protein
MKATSAILVTAFAAAVLVGCDKKDPAATAPKDAPKTEAPKAGTDAKTAAKPYPLDVCLVSGEKLGSMGAPVVYVHEGQEVKFCCKSCQPDFKKEPAKFLAKLAPKK